MATQRGKPRKFIYYFTRKLSSYVNYHIIRHIDIAIATSAVLIVRQVKKVY